jgi:hypothetical protein
MAQSCEQTLKNIETILNQIMLTQSGHTLVNGTITATVANTESSQAKLQYLSDSLDGLQQLMADIHVEVVGS